MDDDNDGINLSGDALNALQEFYQEKDAREKRFEQLKSSAEQDYDEQNFDISLFAEDWNASQFWYSDDTASILARKLLDGATSDTSIAVVSAPSVFVQLKKLTATLSTAQQPLIRLLEYDERFAVFKDFVRYDYAQPFRLPGELKGRFDHIICDPPFLNDDCQTKTAMTVRWLAKSWNSDLRMISCTGERMETLILKLYEKIEVKTTSFLPVHTKGLSNEFRCYSNLEF